MKDKVIYTDDEEFAAAFAADAGYTVKPLSAMKNYTFFSDLRRLGFQSKYIKTGGGSAFQMPTFNFIERCLEYIEFLEFDLSVPMEFEVDGTPIIKTLRRQSLPKIEGDRFQYWDMTESTSDEIYKVRIHLRDYSKVRKSLRLNEVPTSTNKGNWHISWGSILYSASYLDCLLYQSSLRLHNNGFRAPRPATLSNDTTRITLIHKMLMEVFYYKYESDLPLTVPQLKTLLENDLKREDTLRIGFRIELSPTAAKRSTKAWDIDYQKMAPFANQVWVPTYRQFLSKRLYSIGDGY